MAQKKHELKTCVDYQAEAVVSKTLLDKEKGTITIFSFDKGSGLSEHTSPYDAIVNVLEGEAEIRIAEDPIIVKEGELIIMPAGKPHSLKANQRFKMMLIMIRDKSSA
jgi:quercetin dioxygenase-like cupin family protein